jgi:hypothetical protein
MRKVAVVVAALAVVVWLVAKTTSTLPGASTTALQLVGEPQRSTGTGPLIMDGRIKNTGPKAATGVITVTLFGGDGKIATVCTGSVNEVAPGEEVTYSALCRDERAAWTKAEAKIATQFTH